MDSQFQVEINNRQDQHAIQNARFTEAVAAVFLGEDIASCEMGIAVVGNQEIHDCNVKFLSHDYPTDVITFPMERKEQFVAGEIMVSAEYAAEEAQRHGWPVQDELTLYIIHGCLHLVGYDDHSPSDIQVMRQKELFYLAKLDIEPPSNGSGMPNSPEGVF